MRELALYQRTLARLQATMINTPVFEGHATPPATVAQYVIIYPGAGRGDSDRLDHTFNALDWDFTIMAVGRTVGALLAVLGRVRSAFLGYDLEPENPSTGPLFEPEGQEPAINTDSNIEGDTRHSITVFYRLTTER